MIIFTSSLGLDFRLLPLGATADQTATLLSLDATAHTDVVVPDESPDSISPALVVRQRLIKLLGNFIQGMKPCPRDSGEIVVLVVISDIVGKEVERTIVGEGLRKRDLVVRIALSGGNGLIYVMLGDEMASQGVQAASQEGGEQQVEKGVV